MAYSILKVKGHKFRSQDPIIVSQEVRHNLQVKTDTLILVEG